MYFLSVLIVVFCEFSLPDLSYSVSVSVKFARRICSLSLSSNFVQFSSFNICFDRQF